MAQSGDLPRFVISRVDDVTRSPQDADQQQQQQQQQSTGDGESTDARVNGNIVSQSSHFHRPYS